MEQLSFFEKLQVLGSNILAHPLFIVLLLLPVILIALNKKITKKIIILVYLGVLAIVLFVGNTTIFKLFDNMIDGLFMTLYFPNFITLFVVVVLSAIITLITFLKKHVSKVIKIINVSGFAIIQTLFCLILTTVQVNNIDIYKDNALYGNDDVLTLMQLLMGAFALQIISLLVIYAINKVTGMLDEKDGIITKTAIDEQIENLKQTRIINHKPREMEVVLEPQKPLDQSLIDKVKLSPVSLEDAINKRLQEKMPQSKPKKPDLLKPMEAFKNEAPIELADFPGQLEDIKSPKIKENITDLINKEVQPVVSKVEENNEKPKFANVIKASPLPEEPMEPKETKKEEIKPTPEKPKFTNVVTATKKEEPVLVPKIDSIKQVPVIEPIKPELKQPEKVVETSVVKEEPNVLVNNLNIVNFDKTLVVIKNLKRMYTM